MVLQVEKGERVEPGGAPEPRAARVLNYPWRALIAQEGAWGQLCQALMPAARRAMHADLPAAIQLIQQVAYLIREAAGPTGVHAV